MEEKLVSYKVAKLAKEVGFNVVTEYRFFYNSELTTKTPSQSSKPTIYAPTQSLLQKWIREAHKIHLTPTSISQESWQCHIARIGDNLGTNYIEDAYTYEEALEDGLQEALKLIKDEKI